MADDVTTTATVKKWARRVSFAEFASVHEFVRDEAGDGEEDRDEIGDGDEELEEEQDEDRDDVEAGRLVWLPPPASTVGSATSNDEELPGPCIAKSGVLEVGRETGVEEKKEFWEGNDKTSSVNPSPHLHTEVLNSWANIIKPQTHRLSLNYVKPTVNEKGFLALEKGTSSEGEQIWQHTLVGYSIDRRISFNLLQQRVRSLWVRFGLKNIRANKEGFFFFSFKTEEGVMEVLNKGPWIVLGQQLYLKQWRRNFDFCRKEFKSIRNWSKLYGIPTTYWSSSGLRSIASKIGIPLYADEITFSSRILDFARICVDMEIGSEFPSSFRVLTEFGEVFEFRVEYGWRPRHCNRCKVVGHLDANCPIVAKPSVAPIVKPPNLAGKLGQWVPKPKSTTIDMGEGLPNAPNLLGSETNPFMPLENLDLEDRVQETISSKEVNSSVSNIHSPFKALGDFVDRGLAMVGNVGSTEGASTRCQWSSACINSKDEAPSSAVAVLEEVTNGKNQEGYKSGHKDDLDLNAKPGEEGDVPLIPYGRK